MAKGQRRSGQANAREPEPEPQPAAPAAKVGKGKPVSTKLYETQVRKLADLARFEELGSSAEAFDKHFGALLDNLLIAATAKRLKQLQEEKGA